MSGKTVQETNQELLEGGLRILARLIARAHASDRASLRRNGQGDSGDLGPGDKELGLPAGSPDDVNQEDGNGRPKAGSSGGVPKPESPLAKAT